MREALDWTEGGPSAADLERMRRAGMNLKVFDRVTVHLRRRPNGTVWHLRPCAELVAGTRDAAAVHEDCPLLELPTRRLHRDCTRFSPLSRPVERWLTAAVSVAEGLAALEELEQSPDITLAHLHALVLAEQRFTSRIDELSGALGRTRPCSSPLILTKKHAATVKQRMASLIARTQETSAPRSALRTAAAQAAPERLPFTLARAAGAPAGRGACLVLDPLWKRWRGQLMAGATFEAAEAKVRQRADEAASDLAHAGVDLDRSLAHWRAALEEEMEAGAAPVLVGIASLPAAWSKALLAATPPRPVAACPEGGVFVLAELAASIVVQETTAVLFGPAEDDALVELVAGMWDGSAESARRIYEAAVAIAAQSDEGCVRPG